MLKIFRIPKQPQSDTLASKQNTFGAVYTLETPQQQARTSQKQAKASWYHLATP